MQQFNEGVRCPNFSFRRKEVQPEIPAFRRRKLKFGHLTPRMEICARSFRINLFFLQFHPSVAKLSARMKPSTRIPDASIMRTIPFRRSLCLWFLLFAPCLVARADEKADVDSIIAAGREGNRVMEHLDYLCNRFGPRLTGSDNLQNASEWARDTFASFGLENAHLEQWGTYAVGFNRGPWFGSMIQPAEKALHFGTNAWSAGTKGVMRGRAVLTPLNEE